MFDVGKALRYARRHPLPLWAGFSVIGTLQLVRVYERRRAEAEGRRPASVAVRAYKVLPLRTLSRWWGKVHDRELPEWSRPAVLGAYVRLFGCNMEEAEEADLRQYRNLGELFRRRLRPEARPVSADPACCLVSPCDGRVAFVGPVSAGGEQLEAVKGVRYSLREFLGGAPRTTGGDGSTLYQCVLYLAPGDYHGFHAPANWKVRLRRHFDGLLLSVSPGAVRAVDGLFSINERVVYEGTWANSQDDKDDGGLFFSFSAVGATNVGSIVVPSDPSLSTNSSSGNRASRQSRRQPKVQDIDGLDLRKGDYFGEFNLGSSIVLVFESRAADGLEFKVNVGDKVNMGQALATSKLCESSNQK